MNYYGSSPVPVGGVFHHLPVSVFPWPPDQRLPKNRLSLLLDKERGGSDILWIEFTHLQWTAMGEALKPSDLELNQPLPFVIAAVPFDKLLPMQRAAAYMWEAFIDGPTTKLAFREGRITAALEPAVHTGDVWRLTFTIKPPAATLVPETPAATAEVAT